MIPRRIATLALSVALCLCASSCSVDEEEPQEHSSSTDLNLKADIDREALTVTLPASRYILNNVDRQFLESAQSAAVAKCAREELNIPWVGWSLDHVGGGKRTVFSEFGPWTKAMAEHNAFGNPDILSAPPTNVSPNHPGILNGKIPDNQMDKMVETCHPKPEVSQFDPIKLRPKSPWTVELTEAGEKLLKDDRAKQVFSEVASCYESKGMKMNPEAPGYVKGFTSDDRTPQAFAAAIKAAECQEKLNATPRLVEIWAELQAPIITKYADELIAQRQKIDKAVADAKEYINAHPELFEPPK
ncbi:hypothetical protein JOD55_000157 [Arcanobacterium pluranimalium]|uniref:hypothetical protein n=1 Tax=Arcanobacterium pluranimalium TaxID=108028 RepID=UPI0019582456|nr:hypothetical protein [Arcanobacterium pluranimalium]MBM7824330.1 hypothetical protein [Arcanobacterium pluranimalium]